jgi:hypothetical protein
MANVKISDLTAYTDAASTDILPIVDIGNDVTKKITIGNVVKAVPLGTAALPGLAFDGDPNTGIFSPTADTLAITTGGSERLRVDSSGRLGLGTSSPQTLLHLSALNTGGGAANVIRITDQDTAVVANQICGRIEFETADATTPGVNCQIDVLYSGSGGGAKLQFRTGFAGALVDALHISDTGAVGIGNASPSSLLHLADAGNITVGTTTGTKIGTATTQKLGFYNATPVVQPAAVADATTAVDVITQLNDLLAKLRTLGIIAT